MTEPTYTAEQIKDAKQRVGSLRNSGNSYAYIATMNQAALTAAEEREKESAEFWDAAMSQSVGLRYDYKTGVVTNERAETAEEREKELQRTLIDERKAFAHTVAVMGLKVAASFESGRFAEAQLAAIRDAPVAEMRREFQKIADEICDVYDVTTPRGKKYSNLNYETIFIIIAENIEPIIATLTRKIAALEAGLNKSNAGFEEYERKFYLEQDRAEKAEAENSQLKAKGGAGGWIAVGPDSPSDGRTVIVEGGIAFRIGEKWISQTGSATGRVIQWEVTHWQPLPSPPQDGAKG